MAELTNCPNCGAPVTSCRCEYCGTVLQSNAPDLGAWTYEVRACMTLDGLLQAGTIKPSEYIARGRPSNRDAIIAYQVSEQEEATKNE